MDIPYDARFTAAIAFDPARFECPGGATFEVRAAKPGGEEPRDLLALWLDPQTDRSHRGLVPVEVDLAAVAGPEATLTLAVSSGSVGSGACDNVAWVEPTVVSESSSSLDLLHDGPNRIFRNRNALPRAWLVRRAIEVEPGNLDLVSRCLGSRTFEPAVEAVVEGRVGSRLGVSQPGDGVVIADYASRRVELEVRTAEPAILVMSDMVYPGWRATVDGVDRPILPTNMIMRGVVVGGGTHRVVFEYRPAGLRWGLATSTATVVVVGLGLVLGTRRRRALPS